MYLARVEMTGFKSFADKTVIEFDQGMTAVVGPNGSGKSNLSEAIRWVLGEQSAKSLRGSKMEDVIFNGTADRKAVNLAKVTLVLNNEDRYLDYDFSEISITRSYNRNGESNYYINNESVRLKDIVDLLLDSGFGKNSFAMISQGKVESIFLNKPEERRTIFEEAAGVQKYQYRKIEAERKLLKSTDHLSRVKDIIHEIEGQLKPLKRQSETALKFQAYQKELSSLEVSLYTYQIGQNKEKWQQAKAKFAEITQNISQYETKLLAINQTILEQQATLDAVIQSVDQDSEQYQLLVRNGEQAKAKLQMLQQERQFSQTTSQDKVKQYEAQVVQQTQLTAQIEQLLTQKGALEKSLSELSTQLDSLKHDQQLASGAFDNQVEQLRNEMIEYYQQEAAAKNELTQLTTQIEQQSYRVTKFEQQLEQLNGSLKQNELTLQKVAQQLASEKAQQQTTANQLQQLQQQWQKLRQQKDGTQKALFEADRQLNTLTVRANTLVQMQEQYEGYYGGVRVVMQQAKQLGGINGTVAELIQVNSDLQVAIDTALGGALQHIVVEDDSAARRAIQFLKQQRAGRATFLPRTNIRARYLNGQHQLVAENQAGYIGIASELIQFDAEYANIIENLLGNTIIMDAMTNAQQLSKRLNHQVKIVTLDGEVLMPGGSISGGRQKQQGHSVLSRQHDIETIQSQIATIQTKHQQLEAQFKEIEQAEQQVTQHGEQTRSSLEQLSASVNQLQQQHHQLTVQIETTQKTIKVTLLDKEQASKSYETAQNDYTHAQQTVAEMTQRIQEGTKTLEQLNESQTDRQQRLVTLNQQIAELTTQQAVLKTEQRQVTQQLTTAESQLTQVSQLIEQFAEHHTYSERDLSRIELEIEQAEQMIQANEVEQTQLHQQIEIAKLKRSELNQQTRSLEQEKINIQQVQQKAFQEQAQLQAQIEKYDELITNHLMYLNETYQLSYEAAVETAEVLEDMTAVATQVKALRKQIDALGPINLAAIADYEELNQRYTYLIEQQDDLLTAMAQLQVTMDEMDAEVIKRFSEAFTQINQQFKRTFKKLFGGGEAALELTNPNDLLTTGVDIIAQPPGKRKQNLALLSGGERAFTAIALLFAILETKPVPFCVLDEVEAALDDANVWRYGEYLQQFTENTQFIVITHRKGTMEHADVLYGVTMERSGVSKLASVRLSDAEV